MHLSAQPSNTSTCNQRCTCMHLQLMGTTHVFVEALHMQNKSCTLYTQCQCVHSILQRTCLVVAAPLAAASSRPHRAHVGKLSCSWGSAQRLSLHGRQAVLGS